VPETRGHANAEKLGETVEAADSRMPSRLMQIDSAKGVKSVHAISLGRPSTTDLSLFPHQYAKSVYCSAAGHDLYYVVKRGWNTGAILNCEVTDGTKL
jgi:hypothetical protein